MRGSINHPNPRTSILLIGASGLIGSRIKELLTDFYHIETAGTSSGLDITNPLTFSPIKDSEASVVIHLAAKADVDGCEDDKALGKDGAAWKLNVEGARNVADVCRETSKKMIYFSTDFVFDGEKDPPYEYGEEDIPNPVNWYSMTKYEGEKAVHESGVKHIILRTAYPYRSNFPEKKDFVRLIRSRLQSGEPVRAVTDHIMSPTFIDDIAFAVDALIKNDSEGIFHVVGSDALSPYQAAVAIAHEFELDSSVISQTIREAFFKDRAKRPFNLALKNGKIQRLGVRMNSFLEGLQLMHRQEKTV